MYNKGIKTVKGKTEMKKISGILKLTLAVCLTVGATLAMIACVANNSQGSSSGIGTASTSSPLETQTTTPTETTTSGQTETTTSTETTTTPPIVDKKQETINKFLTLLDEMAERNGVDEIRDIMLFQKKPELATSDYFQLSFGAVDNMTYNDILEYYILTEEEYKAILSSINYNFIPNYTYHLSNEKLLSRDKSTKSIDIINNSIETKERYNEDNPYKYEIDYEKKKEKDLAEFNDFLAKVSAEHGGKNVETFEIQKVDDSFRRIIFYYKKAEGVYINLRYYGVDEQLYSKFVEKFHLNQQGVVSISVKDIVDNYESEFFDELLNTLRTHLPVINPNTL